MKILPLASIMKKKYGSGPDHRRHDSRGRIALQKRSRKINRNLK